MASLVAVTRCDHLRLADFFVNFFVPDFFAWAGILGYSLMAKSAAETLVWMPQLRAASGNEPSEIEMDAYVSGTLGRALVEAAASELRYAADVARESVDILKQPHR